MSYCETFNMKFRILRLSNVIGVGDKKISRKRNALQYMIQQVALGNKVDYLYREDSYRDYIDVRDCARAIKLVLDRGAMNEIYNIGNGIPRSINNAVFVANSMAGERSEIELMEPPDFHKKVQVKDMWLDTTKLKSLGYKPDYTFLDTIQNLLEHYSNG